MQILTRFLRLQRKTNFTLVSFRFMCGELRVIALKGTLNASHGIGSESFSYVIQTKVVNYGWWHDKYLSMFIDLVKHLAKDTLHRQRDVTIIERNSLSETQNNKKSISQRSDIQCSHCLIVFKTGRESTGSGLTRGSVEK